MIPYFFELFINNIITIPIIAFIFGILFSFTHFKDFFSSRIKTYIINFLLFAIGLKGGFAFMDNISFEPLLLLSLLVIWGLMQPLLSYAILIRFTKLDKTTAAAVSACFGSVSVMTYVAAANFLEQIDIRYDGLVVVALALMEIPAIASGLFISKIFSNSGNKANTKKIVLESIFNKTVLLIIVGMLTGICFYSLQLNAIQTQILVAFNPLLALFLFIMGNLIGKHRSHLAQFSWSLIFFGIYMPLLGAVFGIVLSYFLHLDIGTGTLISVLLASASYIAVPAAMKIALPEAKEAIYLPLSLGITFPFNVLIGIPLYYQMAAKFL